MKNKQPEIIFLAKAVGRLPDLSLEAKGLWIELLCGVDDNEGREDLLDELRAKNLLRAREINNGLLLLDYQTNLSNDLISKPKRKRKLSDNLEFNLTSYCPFDLNNNDNNLRQSVIINNPKKEEDIKDKDILLNNNNNISRTRERKSNPKNEFQKKLALAFSSHSGIIEPSSKTFAAKQRTWYGPLWEIHAQVCHQTNCKADFSDETLKVVSNAIRDAIVQCRGNEMAIKSPQSIVWAIANPKPKTIIN